MARLSDLVDLFEAHRVDSGSTLNLFARRLREAGRVTKAGRGRGAASMNYIDAARFMIACLATDHPERAVDAERMFSNLTFENSSLIGQSAIQDNITRVFTPTYETAVATLLAHMPQNEVSTVELRRGSLVAAIRVSHSSWIYSHATAQALANATSNADFGERVASFATASERFRTGKNPIVHFDATLLRELSSLIAGRVPQL